MIKLFTYIGLCLLLFACKKEEQYPDEPEIEFVSITPSSSVEFQGQTIIRISYKDGDGDIGSVDPDVYSVFIKDARLPAADEFHVQPLTPPGQDLQIEGELDIILTGLFITDTNASQTTSFSVTLRDQAGNLSNAVQTSTITINRAS